MHVTRICRVFFALGMLLLSGCQWHWIRIASVDSEGMQGSSGSRYAAISADGRYVAYESSSPELAPGNTAGEDEIYLTDQLTGTTTRVSQGLFGAAADNDSREASISDDGRFVAYSSWASNLVVGDLLYTQDIFVYDRVTGKNTRITNPNPDNNGLGNSSDPAISADGRYVAYESGASGLVPGDNNHSTDIFVYDRNTGETERVSIDSDGNEVSNGGCIAPAISGDGRFVAFVSSMEELVPGDNNNYQDIFVRDRQAGITTRVSVNPVGGDPNHNSFTPAISHDGRYVAYVSAADNLVEGDSPFFRDAFVYDRETGVTRMASRSIEGLVSRSAVHAVDISADGQYVAFSGQGNTYVDNDFNQGDDVFLHHHATGYTRLVSLDSSGRQGIYSSEHPALSTDGRYVAFHGTSPNLVPNDTNGSQNDVYVRALPELSVTGLSVDTLYPGATTRVEVSGRGFVDGLEVLVNHARVQDVDIQGANLMSFDITVAADAPPGTLQMLLVAPGTGPGIEAGAATACRDCFNVASE